MSSALASNLHVEVDRPDDDNTEMEVLTIPYGFYNENTGAAAAAVIVANNFLQAQAAALVNAFAGIRLNVFGLIIRVDGAVSEEGGAVQMFFNHTY